jgi:hypothetical protein
MAQGNPSRRSSSTTLMPTWPRSLRGAWNPDEIETYSNGIRKAVYRDPDGNELGFGGAPLHSGSST